MGENKILLVSVFFSSLESFIGIKGILKDSCEYCFFWVNSQKCGNTVSVVGAQQLSQLTVKILLLSFKIIF